VKPAFAEKGLLAPRLALVAVAFDLALVGLRIWTYPQILKMPGARAFIVEPTLALIIFMTICAAMILWPFSRITSATASSTHWGLLGGVILAIHLALEDFGRHIGEDTSVTLAFMLITFAGWGVAGWRHARLDRRWRFSPLAGCWAGMVSTLMIVSFGYILMFLDVPSADYIAIWPEFKQSGWSDARAFGICNSLDAGFSHLLAGIVIGIAAGGIGGAFAASQNSKSSCVC